MLAKETWGKSEEPGTHGKSGSAKDRMKMVPKSKAQTTAGEREAASFIRVHPHLERISPGKGW